MDRPTRTRSSASTLRRGEGGDWPELARLPEWLAKGYAGEMKYLHDARRGSPAQALPGVRSVIVCALNYNTSHPYSTEAAAAQHASDAPRGWISRYAWGDDYHDVLGRKLETLSEAMRGNFRTAQHKVVCGHGPGSANVSPHKRAGLGWLAKNTLLIHPELGSWFFLRRDPHKLEFAATETAAPLARRESAAPSLDKETGRLRQTFAVSARCASRRARRAQSSSLTCSMRGAAFPISRSSCAARSRKGCARQWDARFSAATFARMFARGTARRRQQGSHASRPARKSICTGIGMVGCSNRGRIPPMWRAAARSSERNGAGLYVTHAWRSATLD